jgi:hypothetical protein
VLTIYWSEICRRISQASAYNPVAITIAKDKNIPLSLSRLYCCQMEVNYVYIYKRREGESLEKGEEEKFQTKEKYR